MIDVFAMPIHPTLKMLGPDLLPKPGSRSSAAMEFFLAMAAKPVLFGTRLDPAMACMLQPPKGSVLANLQEMAAAARQEPTMRFSLPPSRPAKVENIELQVETYIEMRDVIGAMAKEDRVALRDLLNESLDADQAAPQ